MQINKVWGIDLTNRKMKYQPWPIKMNEEYKDPEKKEIEETYSISGEAISETLIYFEECGGDTDKLIELLNGHIIDKKFTVNRDQLLDRSRWYTNEYYFYFIMFSKKIIGRYDFHYGENSNEPLTVYHKIYEQGFIRYVPWGDDESGNITHEITSLNLYLCILVLENIFKIDTDEFISFLNNILPEKYTISKEFLINESIWCSLEFIDYGFEFHKILTNSESSLNNGTYLVSINDLKLPRILFPLNKKTFFKNLTDIFKKFNDIANVDIVYKNNKFSVAGYVKEGVYNIKYRKYFKASLLNASKAFTGFVKTVLDIVFSRKQTKDFDAKIDYDINKPAIFICKKLYLHKNYSIYFISILIIVLSLLFSYYFSFVKTGIIGFYICSFIISFLGILLAITINKKNELNKKVETNYLAAQEQIGILEKTTATLINERNLLEEKVNQRTKELLEKNDKLKEVDKARINFFANISHELHTPLTLITGPINAILSGDYGEKIDKKNNIFTTILNNAHRLLKIINNMLDFSKIETNRMNIKKEKTNISNLLKHYISPISSAMDDKNIKLKFINRSNNLTALIDRDLFETVIFNILSNAFKFTPHGGKITIDLNKENNDFVVTISDTGPGIAEDITDIIFENFIQEDESAAKNYEIVGVGLSLTREIVKILDGEITVKSKSGEGSILIVKLPIDYPDINGKENSFKEVKPELLIDFKDIMPGENSTNYEGNKKNIFIIEDNTFMIQFLETILSNDYNIFTAINGKKALNMIDEIPAPDLIISDIMMPEMDGKTFFKELKKMKKYKNIPFIFLTARLDIEEKIEGLKDGAVDYICKPFSQEELIAKIGSLLSSYENLKNSLKEKLIDVIDDRKDINKRKNLNTMIQLYKTKNISTREMDIINLLEDGYEYKEIGNLLKISANTVSNHIQNI